MARCMRRRVEANRVGSNDHAIDRRVVDVGCFAQAVSGLFSNYSWTPFEALTSLPHLRTRGIDNSDVLWRGAFDVWDFAGQAEYYPAHALVASEVRGVSVVMCDASVRRLSANDNCDTGSSSLLIESTRQERKEGKKSGIAATTVLIVLTHIDTMNANDVRVALDECDRFVESEFNNEWPLVGLVGGKCHAIDYRGDSASIGTTTAVEEIKALLERQSSAKHACAFAAQQFVGSGMASDAAHVLSRGGELCRRCVGENGVVDAAAVRRVQLLCETSVALQECQSRIRLRAVELQRNGGVPVVEMDALRTMLSSVRSGWTNEVVDTFVVPLRACGSMVVVNNEQQAVLSPVQWMAARLGLLFDPHDAPEQRIVRDGVVDVATASKMPAVNDAVGQVEFAVLLDVLAAQKIGVWLDGATKQRLLVPALLPRRFNEAVVFDDELFRLAVVVGRRFVLASGRSLPPSLFGLVHVLLFEIDGGGGGRGDDRQWVGEARRRIESTLVRVRDCGIGGVEVIVGAANSSDAMRQLSIVCRCVETAFDDYRALAVTKRCVCVDCARSGVLDTCVIDATDIATTTEPAL